LRAAAAIMWNPLRLHFHTTSSGGLRYAGVTVPRESHHRSRSAAYRTRPSRIRPLLQWSRPPRSQYASPHGRELVTTIAPRSRASRSRQARPRRTPQRIRSRPRGLSGQRDRASQRGANGRGAPGVRETPCETFMRAQLARRSMPLGCATRVPPELSRPVRATRSS
jgi:hypothetical protein